MNPTLATLLLALVGFPATGPDDSGDPPIAPPVARKVPVVTTIHGDTLVDDYRWLRDRDSHEVLAYLAAENAYADARLRHLAGLRETLYQELVGRLREDDADPPRREGDYLYYARLERGKAYPIHCRKPADQPDAPEQVVLDLNPLAVGKAFLGTSGYSVSDDGRKVAYTLDETGYRINTLYIKDVASGLVLPDRLEKVRTWAWSADNQTILYTVEDAAKRAWRVLRHTLGADPTSDPVLFEDPDDTFRVSVRRTRDRKYLVLASRSANASEYRTIPADRPAETPRLIVQRDVGYDVEVDHAHGRFYLRTDRDAPEFRLVSTADDDLSPAAWTELVPPRDGITLRGLTLFDHHAVIQCLDHGRPVFERVDLDHPEAPRETVQFPEESCAATADSNSDYQSAAFRYRYQSLITPPTIHDFDLETGRDTIVKRLDVPGGHDPTNYAVERTWATAPDGARVPISIAYRKTTPRDGSAPLLLYGYGAYGALTPPFFQSPILSLLDRGMIYAIAHVRGGGDLGRAWQEDGKMLHKQHTFDDFIACADYLVDQKYTRRDRLAVRGLSAGGLLIGAVLNQRPDLCKAAVLDVPFVDAINTMLDASIPLTGPEFLEWGNPAIREQYEYIKTYCPYTNLHAADYPAMLVRGSYRDSQVQYWEPAKYVARMRTLRTDKEPLLLVTNMTAGHGGASGRYDNLRETAFLFAFLIDQLGTHQEAAGPGLPGKRP